MTKRRKTQEQHKKVDMACGSAHTEKMSCYSLDKGDGRIQGWICLPDIFKFPHNGKVFYFEYHRFLGPTAVHKRTLDPRRTVPPGFYQAVAAFEKL